MPKATTKTIDWVVGRDTRGAASDGGLWRACLISLGILAAFTSAAGAPGPAAFLPTAGPPGPAAGRSDSETVVIQEVMANPDAPAPESASEWIELLNVGAQPVDLNGWRIEDNRSADELPSLAMQPGEFWVVAAGPGFREAYPNFSGHSVEMDGQIGNGLANGGDRLRLLDAAGREVDAVSYGTDTSVMDPPLPAPEEGHSLERSPAGADTGQAGDWRERTEPSPGGPGEESTATATGSPGPEPTGLATPTSVPGPEPTGTATAVASASAVPTAASSTPSPTGAASEPPRETPPLLSPTATLPVSPVPSTPEPGAWLMLNEYLAAPRAVDWNQDGRLGAGDEWVEIASTTDVALDLSGWQLDDVDAGGSPPFVLEPGTVLPAGGFLLLYSAQTGVALNNDGDTVSLKRPDGSLADSTTFGRAAPDRSIGRVPDRSGPWTDQASPSPGRSNDDRATPVPGPTGTSGAGAVLLPFLISEVLFDGPTTGGDTGEEWVEIHNRTQSEESLLGWAIADGAASDPIGDAVVPPRGFAVVAASPTDGALTVADGRIGNGLANGGDVVQLVAPNGRIADAVSYGSNVSAFDPSVPLVPAGTSIERIPADQDTDSAIDWWRQDAPSPGAASAVPAAAPKLLINEVCPEPYGRDWDGDGTADYRDEWIEIYNPSASPVRMVEWRARLSGSRYEAVLPPAVVRPHEYLTLFRRDTGLFLREADELTLIREDGVTPDSVSWTAAPRGSWGRYPDGGQDWVQLYPPSPGAPNRLGPARDPGTARPSSGPTLITLSEIDGLSPRRRIRVRGVVSAPTGLFGRQVFYVVDDRAGIRVRLKGDSDAAAMEIGDRVLLTGRVGTSFGERQLNLESRGLIFEAGSAPPAPIAVRTGELAAAVGRLVSVGGRVEAWSDRAIEIDDGSGRASILFRRETGARRPWVMRGEWLELAGIVSRFARDASTTGGYRVMPRGGFDLAATERPPLLPATGQAGVRVRPRAGRPSPARTSAPGRG